MITWAALAVLLSSVQALITTWLAFKNSDLQAENEQLRAHIAELEAPTDYLAKESE